MPDDPMQGEAKTYDAALRGHTSLNNAVRTAEVTTGFTLTPGPVDTARDVIPGTGSVTFSDSTGGYAVTGEKQALETTRLLEYMPGGELIAAQLLHIPKVPDAGAFEFGIGRIQFPEWRNSSTFTPSTNEVFLRLDADGDYSFIVKRDGAETVLPQDGAGGTWSGDLTNRSWHPRKAREVVTDENGDVSGRYWGYDPMDGEYPDTENKSAIGLQPPVTILPKIFGTWYGKGPYLLTLEAMGPSGYQRPWPAVAFESTNPGIIAQPNHPLMARYDDGAGNTETAYVFGRQGSHVGTFRQTPQDTYHDRTEFTVDSGSESSATVVLLYRRKDDAADPEPTNYAGTEFGLLNVGTYTEQRTKMFGVLDPTIGGVAAGESIDWTRPNGVNPDNETSTAIEVAWQDTAGNLLTVDPSTGKRFGGEVFGAGKNDATVANAKPVDQPTPRTKPIALMAYTRTGNQEAAFEANVVLSESR